MASVKSKASSEDEWMIVDDFKPADEENRTSEVTTASKDDDANQAIPTKKDEDVETTVTVPVVPIEVKAVVKQATKKVKAVEVTKKDEEANTDEDIAEIETDTDNGELREVKVEATNLVTNLAPVAQSAGGSAAGDASGQSVRPEAKQERWEISYSSRYTLYILMLTVIVPVAYFTSYRSMNGRIALLFFYAYFYLACCIYPSLMKKLFFVRFLLKLIKQLGIFLAVLATLVLIEGLYRTPFVWGGAAALFSICLWAVVALLLQLVFFTRHYSCCEETVKKVK